jgi:hypothetical protein
MGWAIDGSSGVQRLGSDLTWLSNQGSKFGIPDIAQLSQRLVQDLRMVRNANERNRLDS